MSYALKILAVIDKDIRSEYRSKYALNSALLFCVTSLVVVSFSLGGSVTDPRLQAALLWIILFFSSMMSLPRAFVKEQDCGTMNTLRLTCEPSHVFIGKMIINLLLLSVVTAIVSPLFFVLFNISPPHPGFFIITAASAAVGLSAVCTLLSAIVAQARARGTLFPVLAFPVLMPVFMVAVEATGKSLLQQSPWANSQLIVFLVCYAVVGIVGGSLLFEFVFNE